MNARATALAIGLAAPQRAIRVSLVGDEHQTRRGNVNRMIFLLRRDGYAIEMAWHVEPNPAGTGHHLHGWQHGDYIPQARLQERAQAVGMGIPYIEKVKQQTGRGASVGYGLKGVSYGLKLAESGDMMSDFLEANGGRLVHATRHFWRDGADSITLVEARKRATTREGSDPGPWELVRIG